MRPCNKSFIAVTYKNRSTLNVLKSIGFLLLVLSINGCANKDVGYREIITAQANMLQDQSDLKHSSIMVVGTAHYKKDVLNPEKQKSIAKLVDALIAYKPTKIVVEWDPILEARTQSEFQQYLKGEFDIGNRQNEVYQLGFRVAKAMNHNGLYLFDNQTEYIGNLENFTFDKFSEYAKANDDGFYNEFESQLISRYEHNQSVFSALSIYDETLLRNSGKAQLINEQRMHMYEIKVGVQDNWLGPDWLSRWYQRNIRMASNVLKFAEPGDRILVIVGDNHKWTLDYLFKNTPDFEVQSSWDWLLQQAQ